MSGTLQFCCFLVVQICAQGKQYGDRLQEINSRGPQLTWKPKQNRVFANRDESEMKRFLGIHEGKRQNAVNTGGRPRHLVRTPTNEHRGRGGYGSGQGRWRDSNRYRPNYWEQGSNRRGFGNWGNNGHWNWDHHHGGGGGGGGGSRSNEGRNNNGGWNRNNNNGGGFDRNNNNGGGGGWNRNNNNGGWDNRNNNGGGWDRNNNGGGGGGWNRNNNNNNNGGWDNRNNNGGGWNGNNNRNGGDGGWNNNNGRGGGFDRDNRGGNQGGGFDRNGPLPNGGFGGGNRGRFGSHERNKRAALPRNFDWRDYSDCQSLDDIRYQECGDCWAVASASVMSDRYCLWTHKTKIFAARQLTTCVYPGEGGCDGGWPKDAMEMYKSKGVASGGDPTVKDEPNGCLPYPDELDNKDECPSKCANNSPLDSTKAGDFYEITSKNATEIMEEIFNYGPVVTIFEVFDDFGYMGEGVYQHVSGASQGYHAVRLIGWGEDNNVPYWIAANSWGSDWGDKGYFKILRGKNHCDVESWVTCVYPVEAYN